MLWKPLKTFNKEVNNITFDFIWNHKPAKIKKTTVISQKTAGGLNMRDFSIFDKALKLNWVKRLCSNSDAPWQYIPKFFLAGVGGTELFKCNYDYSISSSTSKIFPISINKLFLTGRTLQQPHPKAKMRFSLKTFGTTDLLL